jgi:8-hydroxy-5-deazaflavin:NADPH oxidoreductase
MTTVGLIGSGRIGSTVATLAVAAGHRVVLSNSRGPQTLGDLVARLGPLAGAGTTAEAAASDLVVVAIPVKAYQDLPAAALAGRVVLDTGNYSPARRDGQIADLDDGTLTSSELLQRLLPGAAVVKVFNNIYFKHLEHLSRPAGAPGRSFLPIAGDDPQAKEAVTAFLNEIGYGTVDAGPLAEGWRQEPGTPAYGTPYGPFDDELGTPADAGAVSAALASASAR